jgi:hypothetical protein
MIKRGKHFPNYALLSSLGLLNFALKKSDPKRFANAVLLIIKDIQSKGLFKKNF